MSAVLHEGAVYNLPARFRFLQFAAVELLDAMADRRNQASAALNSGAGFVLPKQELADLEALVATTRRYFQSVRPQVMIAGSCVSLLVHDAQTTCQALLLLSLCNGQIPGETQPRDQQQVDDLREALSPMPGRVRGERRASIEAEIRLAASRITPRLCVDEPESAFDFILEVLNVAGTPKLLPREIGLLEEYAANDPLEGCLTDNWMRQRIRDMLPAIRIESATSSAENKSQPVAEHGQTLAEAIDATRAAKVTKRSTERGEGREKLIAALTRHHEYACGGCLNQDPIGNNELARQAGVSNSTASEFFDREFGGHTKYKSVCMDVGRLVRSLKVLNGEFAPHELFGRLRPNEGSRGDD